MVELLPIVCQSTFAVETDLLFAGDDEAIYIHPNKIWQKNFLHLHRLANY
ncbi:hypothetical protein DSUL_50215 [Desulfovibrionales bacterium]